MSLNDHKLFIKTVLMKAISYLFILMLFFMIFGGCSESTADEPLNSNSTSGLYSGNYFFNKLRTLPSVLDESSGLILYDSLGWSFNDSGNDPVLYGFDLQTGNIVRQVNVEKAVNTDWEDITQDDGYIYIGNFGNNDGDRRDLKIYIINKNELTDSAVSYVPCDSISFTYSDQVNFEPANYDNSYDCEAFVAYKDSLYLFSKDWVNNITTMYSLPSKPGNYVARRITTYNTSGLVTGADIDAKNNLLVFSGYSKELLPFCYVFYDFTDAHFFNGQHRKIILNDYWGSQTEGIAIQSKDSLYFTSESSFAARQSLFLLKFK